jgi:hypothetical protein
MLSVTRFFISLRFHFSVVERKQKMSKASLETLPSDLLYLILKHLDAYCIVLSFGRVCKRFYQITAGYDQYQLTVNWNLYFHLIESNRA